jgi:hypothetical protein
MEMPEISTVCVKCKRNLTDEERKIGLPLCQNCIGSLTDSIMGKIRKSDEKRIEQEVDNFSRFILSSGELFKLDDITVIQCCFNIFMRQTTELEDKNLIISRKIFSDAIKFMERELENINNKMNNDRSTSSTGNNNLVSMIDKLIQKGMKSGNGADNSTIEGIEKCIDEGMGKIKEKYREDSKKEDSKKEDSKKEDKKGRKKKTDNGPSSKNIKID